MRACSKTITYFFSCFCPDWPKPPNTPLPLDALLPNPKALGVVVDGLLNIDCVPPLEVGAVDGWAPKGEGAAAILEDGVLPNEKVNGVGWGFPVDAVGAPDPDGVEVAVLPPNELGGLTSAELLTADEVVLPPPTFPNNEVFGGAGLGEVARVVENGLVGPDALLLFANGLKAFGFAAVAPPKEFVEPNVDPPLVILVILNLNLGPAAAPEDDSTGAGVVPEVWGTLKPNADAMGFDGSGAAVEPEEAPGTELGEELLGNPKLNLGADALVVDPGA